MTDFPDTNETWLNPKQEVQMQAVLEIVELGRSIRHAKQIKTKQPLARMIVVANHLNPQDLHGFEEVIKDELNIKLLEWANSSNEFIEQQLKLNFKMAGPRLANKVKPVSQRLTQVTPDEINSFLSDGALVIKLTSGETVKLTEEDVLVQKTTRLNGFSESSNQNFTIILDTDLTNDLISEGLIRDFIRTVQDLRKQRNFPVEKRIKLYVKSQEEFLSIVRDYEDLIHKGIVLESINFEEQQQSEKVTIGEYEVLIGIL